MAAVPQSVSISKISMHLLAMAAQQAGPQHSTGVATVPLGSQMSAVREELTLRVQPVLQVDASQVPTCHAQPIAPSFCSWNTSWRRAMAAAYVKRLEVELRMVLEVTLVRPRLKLKVSCARNHKGATYGCLTVSPSSEQDQDVNKVWYVLHVSDGANCAAQQCQACSHHFCAQGRSHLTARMAVTA